jgi:hypothetical protein
MNISKYQSQKHEYLRVTRIISGGMNRKEIGRLFDNIVDIAGYCRAIGGNPAMKNEMQIAAIIFDIFMSQKVPESPVMPEGYQLPEGAGAGIMAPETEPKEKRS